MVPAPSHRVSRVPWYSGCRLLLPSFAYGAFTLSGRLFHNRSAGLLDAFCGSEPRCARAPVWALSVSLAATSEITFVFFSSGYLDVSVHRVPPACLPGIAPSSAYGDWGLPSRVSPFRHPRLSLCAAPRGFSQLIASFFGSQCQGIRPAPFFA